MTSPRKRLGVALGVGVLAATGVLAAAPSAFAGTGTTSSTASCTLPAGQGTKTGPQDVTVGFPDTAKPGDTVTVDVTLGAGPSSSPVALSNVPATPSITFQLGGGATGQVTVTGATTNINVPANAPIVTPPYSGTFQIPATASGNVTLTPVSMSTVTATSFGTFTTPCTLTGATALGPISVAAAPPTVATLGATPSTVAPGTATALSGLNWTAGATPKASLCDSSAANCNAAGITASTLAIGADGSLTGNVTVAPATADGAYTIQVSDGTKSATTPITVKTPPAPSRSITLSTSATHPWSFVKVTGSNFTPNTVIAVAGVNGTNPTGNFSLGYTDSHGNFSTWILVTSTKTTAIAAVELNWQFQFNKLALAPLTVKW